MHFMSYTFYEFLESVLSFVIYIFYMCILLFIVDVYCYCYNLLIIVPEYVAVFIINDSHYCQMILLTVQLGARSNDILMFFCLQNDVKQCCDLTNMIVLFSC